MKKKSLCHPQEDERAHGLCRLCYFKDYNSRRTELQKKRHRQKQKEYYQKNKVAMNERMKGWHLERKYGLTIAEKTKLVAKQKSKCAICKEAHGMKLVVDHDHKTGKVRGLLCNNCNRGIGHLKESTNNLNSAIEYLIINAPVQ